MPCEDYPCCGHTDGLGCDWVSPNEIVPCSVCIDARKPSPYHKGWEGACPTVRENKRIESTRLPIPEGFECEECGEGEDMHSDFEHLCFNCGEGAAHDYATTLHEQGYFDNN